MHVLAMLHAYPPTHNAGAEWAAHSLLRELAARGHHVDVQLSQQAAVDEPYAIDGVRVHPHHGKADPTRWLDKTDLIVTHLENTPRATLLGQRTRVPVVHLLHNTFDRTRRWLANYPPALAVYNTTWMAKDTAVWWQLHEPNRRLPRGMVVHPPVAAADYQTTPGSHITLINLTEEKGAKVFYSLAERMPKRHFLGVLGGYGTQLVREDLPNVEIVSHTPGDRMRDDVYARTRVLLVPSVYESYGRVAVEAMCSGIPVIAHPTPGLREACGEAGVFVDRDDIDGWEAAVRRLHSPSIYPGASRRASARAAKLDPAHDLDTWCRITEEVAARGRPRRRH